MHTSRRARLGAGLLATALALGLAACGGDNDDSTTAAPAQTTMASEMSPTTMANDMSATTMASDMSATTMASGESATGSAMTAPFGPGCAAVPTSGEGSVTGMADDRVATAASNNPVLSTLVGAVTEANLADTLNSAEDITVFAPSDDAFAAVDPETLNAAMADPTGLLTTVLTYHVVPGRLTPEELPGEHVTLQGSTLSVEGSMENFTVNGGPEVVCGNVQTANAT